MPLEPPDQQHWQAAVGYVELGMFQDANDQLEKIDPFNRAAPEVLASRMMSSGLHPTPTQPEERNQFRQQKKFCSTRSRNFPNRRSLNTILLATFVRWETSKTLKII